MPKYKVYQTKWDDGWGQDLGTFLNDPVPDLSTDWERPGRNIEAIQHRCFGTLGRLMAKLVEKGLLSVEEILEISDIESDKNRIRIEKVEE